MNPHHLDTKLTKLIPTDETLLFLNIYSNSSGWVNFRPLKVGQNSTVFDTKKEYNLFE
jgi:hypothetical protein